MLLCPHTEGKNQHPCQLCQQHTDFLHRKVWSAQLFMTPEVRNCAVWAARGASSQSLCAIMVVSKTGEAPTYTHTHTHTCLCFPFGSWLRFIHSFTLDWDTHWLHVELLVTQSGEANDTYLLQQGPDYSK